MVFNRTKFLATGLLVSIPDRETLFLFISITIVSREVKKYADIVIKANWNIDIEYRRHNTDFVYTTAQQTYQNVASHYSLIRIVIMIKDYPLRMFESACTYLLLLYPIITTQNRAELHSIICIYSVGSGYFNYYEYVAM